MAARRFDPGEPELMDRPGVLDAAWRAELANLRGFNRYFGGHRIVRRFLGSRMRPGRRYRVLDLCCGSADLPALVVEMARARGIGIEVVAVDRHPVTLAAAAEFLGDRFPEVRLVQGDARRFGSGDEGVGGEGGYDFVLCSLALHHFSEADAVAVLERVRALARRAALVADLERSWRSALGV
jgi:ubiquinone/menaquinone biosynthesis C-methylase UbiE